MIRNSDIDRLRGLFAKRLIATMDMLKTVARGRRETVGTVADLTVFRKLRELDYCTSYSHRGRFYTLRELAEFDENGLWWIRSVGFSSRGTLVATAEGLVNASEAGYAVEELDAIVRVGTKMCCRNWHGRKDFAALGLEIAMSTSLRRGAFVNSK